MLHYECYMTMMPLLKLDPIRWPPKHYAKLEIGYSILSNAYMCIQNGYLNSVLKEKWKSVLYIPYFIDTLYIYV